MRTSSFFRLLIAAGIVLAVGSAATAQVGRGRGGTTGSTLTPGSTAPNGDQQPTGAGDDQADDADGAPAPGDAADGQDADGQVPQEEVIVVEVFDPFLPLVFSGLFGPTGGNPMLNQMLREMRFGGGLDDPEDDTGDDGGGEGSARSRTGGWPTPVPGGGSTKTGAGFTKTGVGFTKAARIGGGGDGGGGVGGGGGGGGDGGDAGGGGGFDPGAGVDDPFGPGAGRRRPRAQGGDDADDADDNATGPAGDNNGGFGPSPVPLTSDVDVFDPFGGQMGVRSGDDDDADADRTEAPEKDDQTDSTRQDKGSRRLTSFRTGSGVIYFSPGGRRPKRASTAAPSTTIDDEPVPSLELGASDGPKSDDDETASAKPAVAPLKAGAGRAAGNQRGGSRGASAAAGADKAPRRSGGSGGSTGPRVAQGDSDKDRDRNSAGQATKAGKSGGTKNANLGFGNGRKSSRRRNSGGGQRRVRLVRPTKVRTVRPNVRARRR